MVFSSRLGSQIKAIPVDLAECFNLWNILKLKYTSIERTLFWENFAHDIDLKLVLKKYLADKKTLVTDLEKHMESYGIRGPNSYRPFVSTFTNVEALTDQFIANEFLLMEQECLEMMIRAARTATTNDSLRNIFIRYTQEVINNIEVINKYLKLKGWIESPPIYPGIPQGVNDKIDVEEAFLLWDHLTFRYDNIRTTDIIFNVVNDSDFKLLLMKGLYEVLTRQSKILEKELAHFGLPLPDHPPTVMPPGAQSAELFEDDHLFRTIIVGMFGAGNMHARAIKECTTNDRVRNIFKQFLLEELASHSKIIKFGKVKGWFNPVPKYRMLT